MIRMKDHDLPRRRSNWFPSESKQILAKEIFEGFLAVLGIGVATDLIENLEALDARRSYSFQGDFTDHLGARPPDRFAEDAHGAL
jgi:hypothetical protein